jgi:large subunit ribosomal protein L15
LARFESGDEVGPEQMAQFGLVKHAGKPIKILADGDLAGTTLIVKATAFSAEAKRKIEAAGGMAEVLN